MSKDYELSLLELRNKIDAIDSIMLDLFVDRMNTSKLIGNLKRLNNCSILDKSRESEVIKRNNYKVNNPVLKSYYEQFLKHLMSLSKSYQKEDANSYTNTITVNNYENSIYDIIIKKGILNNINKYVTCNKVLLVSDSGIPSEYLDVVKKSFSNVVTYIIKEGESSKNLDNTCGIIDVLLKNDFNRDDYIIALGGGMVLDIVGFAGTIYKRGINYMFVPTTLLAMVDASIGGKNAINYNGVKNLIGTFNNPKCVLVDITLLKTLSRRLFNEGIAEVIKMAVLYEKGLYDLLLNNDIYNNEELIEKIVTKCILLKKKVVEQDFTDQNKRHYLNYGHTIGHALEILDSNKLLHGEAISIGMVICSSINFKKKLIQLLKKYSLPTSYSYDDSFVDKKFLIENIVSKVSLDKKNEKGLIKLIKVSDISNKTFELVTEAELIKLLERNI